MNDPTMINRKPTVKIRIGVKDLISRGVIIPPLNALLARHFRHKSRSESKQSSHTIVPQTLQIFRPTPLPHRGHE